MLFVRLIVVYYLSRNIECTESYYHHVNVSHSTRFANPCKGAMSKMYLDVPAFEQFIPQDAHLLSLCNRVCRNKSDGDARSSDVSRGFNIPARDIIQNARASRVVPNQFHVALLFCILFFLSRVRRIPYNVRTSLSSEH